MSSLFLLAETVDRRSVIFGVLSVGAIWGLIKVATRRSLLVCAFLFISLWLFVISPPAQTWLVGKAISRLSKDLNTTISVGHVDFSFFNKMLLEQTLVRDRNHDTLLYAGKLKVNITDWFFTKDAAELQYIGLEDATIMLHRRDSVWNYQFLADYFGGPEKKDTTKKGIAFSLKTLKLERIHLLIKDEWRGEDMELRLAALNMDAEAIDFNKKTARINALELTEPLFAISNYPGRRAAPPIDTSQIRNDPSHLRWNAGGWDLKAKSVTIERGTFQDNKLDGSKPDPYFDSHHIYFSSINWDLKDLVFKSDTVTANIRLSTKERSGFVVNKLTAAVKFFPEAMEFSNLDIKTGKSRLRKYFALHYNSFDDMSDFVTKVKMEGDFTDADISSDDIAYFAPALKSWNKNIRITGSISGPVENLRGKNILIAAGKNTSLNGDIHLRGLPDIEQTFIEFKSNDFRTTYKDIVTFVPSLKTISQPRLDLIESLRFKGSFNGFIKDFVTNGSIETNLGTLVTDVNMKFPDNKPTIYSGSINTTDFSLGKFLDNDNLGQISFTGKIDGSGLTSKTLNAVLDGNIHNLSFNGYTYQDIAVKGALAKKKFNGQLISSDPNLNAELNGLIDFSSGLPRFNFDAQVAAADFRKLNFTSEPLEFNGKLVFNFTGDDIDNFLGTARIYDAAVFDKGQRIGFDSLTLESSVVDNNKTITVLSNEFDGALVGEFSIRDLPAAFQTFLNKYYPSYIKPARVKLANQNFSFVITTKKVDDYIGLIDRRFKGFNNTSISGRLNTKENLVDLNAEVPQFSYKNVAFNNVNIKGNGNLDSLSAEANIGDVFINDSLHFPATHINIHSSSDNSDVAITTSANQTLTSANIAAQIHTMPDGMKIIFKPSLFDVNSKKWTIDKDGEVILDHKLISVNNLRIYSGDQQVLVTTHPSTEGNWNDVHIDLAKVNIGDFSPYFAKDDRFEGLLTGTSDIKDPFGKQQNISFLGKADQFRLNDDSIGKIDINGTYDKQSSIVRAKVNSDNRNYQFDINGVFNTLDSVADDVNKPVNITVNMKDTKIDLLEKYLSGVFSNVHGFATGQLQIVGAGNQLKYLGKMQLKDGRLKVSYTQCTYKIPLANVDLEDGFIDFGAFQLQDTLGHTGEFTRGKLYHRSFKDMSYDFAINTNKLLLLNTKLSDNNQFYGKVIGRANFSLTGKEENMIMTIRGEPTDSSNIYLPSNSSRETADADFIVWKIYGKEMQPAYDRKVTNLTVNLDLTANNYANVYVVIDPLTKDIIEANGRGNLRISVGTSKDLTISGRYEIDRGSYNFSFQSLIRKPFTFSPEADNYIQWTGDPYNADINVEAVYEAENVRFSDLGLASNNGLNYLNENVKKYRGPVLVTARLTDKLLKPSIAFELDLPPNSPLRNDQDMISVMHVIQNDPNELNKQVSFLLVFDQFGPLATSNATFGASTAITGIFVNSISGVVSSALSRRFSSAFQKIFKDPSIRINFNSIFYNGSNQLVDADPTRLAYDRTNLNLSVDKTFLNERLTFILGSALDFGITAQQAQAASFQFLPDITAEYKITPDGRFALSLFYRDSYNYLSVANHTENRSGASISYTRDFDKVDELFKKKKKTKPKPAPVPPSVTENGSQ